MPTSLNCELEILKAVKTKFSNTSSITDIVGTNIFNAPIQPVDFPYIIYDITESSLISAFNPTSWKSTLRVRAWTRESNEQIYNLKNNIYDLFFQVPLTLDNNYKNYAFEATNINLVFLEPDNITYQAVPEFVLYLSV